MQQLYSSLWVNARGPEEFNGVLTWVTPSAIFRVGATSPSLFRALSTPIVRSYCKKMSSLKREDWVYIDDLTTASYNGRYAQVLSRQKKTGSKVRYGCAIYGIEGMEVHDRWVHQQMFLTVSLSAGNLFKVQPIVNGVRIYADEEALPADAVQVKCSEWGRFSHAANVQIPAGLLGCIQQSQQCPLMKDTSMPLMLQEVPMLSNVNGRGSCYLVSKLKMPAIYYNWDGGNHERYWMDYAGPHLVFREDGANFFVEDMLFMGDFMSFAMNGIEEIMDTTGQFSEKDIPMMFAQFQAERKLSEPACPYAIPDFETAVHIDEEIAHFEAPAYIDEEIASLSAEIQWTEHVQNRIHADSAGHTGRKSYGNPFTGSQGVSGAAQAEKINVLRFGSPAKGGDALEMFRQILLHGPHLQACRDALQEKGLDFVHPQQALMVVTPAQHSDVLRALKGMELHPFHLIVAEQFDYLIEEVLVDIAYKRRPRVKDGTAGRQELCLLSGSSRIESDEDDIAEDGMSCQTAEEKANRCATFIEARTFLCEAPVLKGDGSVSCHSTTEVCVDVEQSSTHYGYRRGSNPRRYA